MENIIMAKDINLGLIGISEGNGHPYSWSAIINGYNEAYLANAHSQLLEIIYQI